MSECRFAAVFSINRLNLCTNIRACSRLFPIVDLMHVLRALKQKRCRNFRYLSLVKVKVTLQYFLLLFRDISCNFLIIVLITIVSLSVSSNKTWQ